MRSQSHESLLDRMAEYRASGTPFVVCTVIRTRGSTPRKAGAKMIVGADGGLFGTVGGGNVEYRVVERARALLARPEVERFEWDLASDEAGGMVCGGSMEFLLEPFLVRPRAFVFGAGHVGQALCRQLCWLGFDVTVADDRPDLMIEDRLSGARLVCEAPPVAAAKMDLPEGAYAVVVNRTHAQDLDTMKVLVRRPLAYLGLMASRKKRREMLEALAADGASPEALERVRTPVGLDIGAETPEEIAVAIAAEMIEVLRKGDRGVRADG